MAPKKKTKTTKRVAKKTTRGRKSNRVLEIPIEIYQKLDQIQAQLDNLQNLIIDHVRPQPNGEPSTVEAIPEVLTNQ
jgi:hypothetical protein